MALVKVKPTSPGRRSLVKVVNRELYKGEPYAPLLESKSKRAGRNNSGHITMRHQGGGHKQKYRIIDFRRNKDTVPARVERIEYDPNRSANIALLCYADGERRYIIAPKGVSVGSQLVSGPEAPIKEGNCMPLRNLPVSSTIHGAQLPALEAAPGARVFSARVVKLFKEPSAFGEAFDPSSMNRCPRRASSAGLQGDGEGIS